MAPSEHVIRGPPLNNVPKVSLGAHFRRICQEQGSKVALVDAVSKKQLTFEQLSNEAIKLAIVLIKRGITGNDVISICAQNSRYYPVVVLAVFYSGAILAPYNNSYTTGELEHVMSLTKPKIVFCSSKTQNAVRNAIIKCKGVVDLIFIESDNRLINTSINDLTQWVSQTEIDQFECPEVTDTLQKEALIMCSSGTTGLPKGVLLTHHNVLASVTIYTQDENYLDKDVTHMVGFLPPFHVFGLITVLLFLEKGITTVVLEHFVPELFLQVIQDYKIKTLALVPPILSFLAKHPLPLKYDLSSLEEIGCGAAPLGRQLEEAVLERFKHIKAIRQGYGMTECTLGVLKMALGEVRHGSVGNVVAGTEVKVIDIETKQPLGPNQRGEICFRGPTVMKGYIDNPQATAETLDSEGWLHSGDIGYYDDQHWFYIVDRLKELIKYKGFQVPPAELEALLITHPAVLDAAVVGIPDDDAGELPKAFIVKRSPVSDKEIRDFVATRVSTHKRLRGGVQFVESIPKNPSGKILRRELRKMGEAKSKL